MYCVHMYIWSVWSIPVVAVVFTPALSALVYIHELMEPKPVVTSYIPDRPVYVYL